MSFQSIVKCEQREACSEAISLGIRHKETEKVLGVLKKYEDGADGKIFHLRKQHWVALQSAKDFRNR